MSDPVAEAHRRATKIIEKAERERDLRVWAAGMTDFSLRTVVSQRDCDWLNFDIVKLEDIIALFDDFNVLGVAEYRGRSRGETFPDDPKHPEEEIVGYHHAAFKASGRCRDYMSAAGDVTVFTYALGLDRPVRIGVDLGSNYYDRPGAPAIWVPSFDYSPPAFRKPGEWTANAPRAWGGLPCWSCATGAPQRGMAFEGLCMIDHAETLEQEIDRAKAGPPWA